MYAILSKYASDFTTVQWDFIPSCKSLIMLCIAEINLSKIICSKWWKWKKVSYVLWSHDGFLLPILQPSHDQSIWILCSKSSPTSKIHRTSNSTTISSFGYALGNDICTTLCFNFGASSLLFRGRQLIKQLNIRSTHQDFRCCCTSHAKLRKKTQILSVTKTSNQIWNAIIL